jgi:hypothetical protein
MISPRRRHKKQIVVPLLQDAGSSMGQSIGEWEPQQSCRLYSQTGQHGSVYWRVGASAVLSSLQPDRSAWVCLLESGSFSSPVVSTARQVSMGLSVGEWEPQQSCRLYSKTGQLGSVCWRVGASAVLSSLQPDRSAWVCLLESGSLSSPVVSTARQVSLGLSVGEWELQQFCRLYSQTGQLGSVY